MKPKLLLAFAFVILSQTCLVADLPYMPVSFRLSTDKKIYKPGERICFRLKIINWDKTRSYPIVLPGTQNKGQKLIRIGAYSVNQKTQFYTCVAKDSPEMSMKCPAPGGVSTHNLAPGDSTEIVFFLNDNKNFLTQTASHHSLDKTLEPGKYEVLIFFDPSGTELKDLYHYIWSTNDSTSAEKLNFWLGGNVSNYTSIEISKTAANPKNLGAVCADNCSFCKQIEEKNWKQIKNTLEQNTKKSEDFDVVMRQLDWMRFHRNVIWVSAPPQSVLSSLPTYFSYDFIFVSGEDLYYFGVGYQWGMVYRSRSRFHQVFRSFRPEPLLPGEDLSYVGLTYFGERTCDLPTQKKR